MNLLTQVRAYTNAEAILGFRYFLDGMFVPRLPDGASLIGYCDCFLFCYMEGYQNTIFVLKNISGYGRNPVPVAYDFREFLRLIVSAGSARAVAEAALSPESHHSFCMLDENDELRVFASHFSLTVVEDFHQYLQTVSRVIDCSGIRC